MALIEARRTTRAGLSSVPAHLGPAMALVQHLRFVDVGRPRQAVERLPDLAVRYRHLRILMHALPITASEIRFGHRGLRRRNQPFDLSAHCRGLVGAGSASRKTSTSTISSESERSHAK